MAKIKTSNRIKQKVLLVVLIITYILIWGQSCLSEEKSQAESDVVLSKLEPVHGVDVEQDHVSDTFGKWNMYVRKSAHVIEYMVLGIELASWVLLDTKEKKKTKKSLLVQRTTNALVIGILTALVDETIQLFSGRGSSVKDVWIDALGVVIGIMVLSIFIVRVCRKTSDIITE